MRLNNFPESEEKAENKELAASILRNFENSQSLIFDQQVDLFKWLTASLLLLNGGAATAVLSNSQVDLDYKLAACVVFGVGVLFALLIAVVAQKRGQVAIKPFSELIGYWMTVRADGIRGEELEIELNGKLADSVKNSWIVPAIGWFSALAFICGAVVSGLGMKEYQAASPASDLEAIRK